MRAIILGLASQAKAGFWDDFWGHNDPTTTDYPTTTTVYYHGVRSTTSTTTSTQEQNDSDPVSGKKLLIK